MQAGVDGLLRDRTRPSRIPPLGAEVGGADRHLDHHHRSAERGDALDGRSDDQGHKYQASSVQRIWRAHGLQPHRVRRFKLSNDRSSPPNCATSPGSTSIRRAHAVVLSLDEKSQIQVLDRTQPGLPMKKGRAGTMTHDYKRHGTTTLFAALDVLEGKVIGRCM